MEAFKKLIIACALLLACSSAGRGAVAEAAAVAANPCAYCNRLGWLSPQHVRIHLAHLPDRWSINPHGNSHYSGVSQEHPFGLPVPPRLYGPASADQQQQPARSTTYPTSSSQLWDTYMFSAGQWFLRQIRTSPLLVDSPEDADVVVVPLATLNLMTWEAGGLDAVAEWYEQAHVLLPLLGRRPHVVALSKGEYDFVDGRHQRYGLVGHPDATSFTFLTHGLSPKTHGNATAYMVDNVISIPFPSW